MERVGRCIEVECSQILDSGLIEGYGGFSCWFWMLWMLRDISSAVRAQWKEANSPMRSNRIEDMDSAQGSNFEQSKKLGTVSCRCIALYLPLTACSSNTRTSKVLLSNI